MSDAMNASISTPDRVESRIGTLEFTDGAPTRETVETLYDHLDFVHGLNAFLNAFPAASTQAIREGFLSIGSYAVTLPPDVPEARFWSLTLYDNQTRSMLVTPQRFPRAGSQAYPTPSAVPAADGSVRIHVGPAQPGDTAEGNWIQTMPGKGWFAILRLYSPLPPFFDKSWRIGEFEPT
jgi:hypothetical protein